MTQPKDVCSGAFPAGPWTGRPGRCHPRDPELRRDPSRPNAMSRSALARAIAARSWPQENYSQRLRLRQATNAADACGFWVGCCWRRELSAPLPGGARAPGDRGWGQRDSPTLSQP